MLVCLFSVSFQVGYHSLHKGLECTSKVRPLGKKSELFLSASLCAQILHLRSAFLSLKWIQYKFCLVNRKLIYRTAENNDNWYSLTVFGGLWKWWSVRIKWEWQSHSKLFWLHRDGISMVFTNVTMSSIH